MFELIDLRAALIEAEVQGRQIEMSSRVTVAAGEYRRAPDGSLGMHVDQFSGSAMLLRWRNHEFDEADAEGALPAAAALELVQAFSLVHDDRRSTTTPRAAAGRRSTSSSRGRRVIAGDAAR